MPAAKVTLVFLLRDGEVLLGLKKTGFGQGKIVGIGGHLEAGESSTSAAVREVFEETRVRVEESALEFRGTVNFRFPNRPEWDMNTAVFRAFSWHGTPEETEEIKPAWYPLDQLPLERMWQDASHWLPWMLDDLTGYPEGEMKEFTERHFTVVMAADQQNVESVSEK
ncbi:8-oxo-dGTP diphosphatase [Psychromicrobium sp. YIM B11713]|uniref:8-oxo-dGTP diphosphatase n=1 Tax=Psychromicrobium sp. YIM B11713 TaxID=3145233 RepID=UPI00374E716A